MNSKYRYKSIINCLLLLGFLVLSTPFAKGQQYTGASFNFNSTVPSGSYNYNARDYIMFQPGFSYIPSAAHPFDAKIDQTIVPNVVYHDATTTFNRTLDKDLPVGSLPGNFNVSLSGTANYSIPIEIAPGTGGMQPNISIDYNSSGGNGLLGLGFSLGGFSSISRTSQNLFNDGNVEEVNFTASDRFQFDGQRLMLAAGGNYGDNNAEYRTEIESYDKVFSRGAAGTGPSYFEVYTKDGKIIQYGNSADSKILKSDGTVITWLITQITDVNGNYITYSYTKNEFLGTWMPKEINYTGNTTIGITPYNKIAFFYDGSRSDYQSRYVNGVLLSYRNLLSKIRTYSEGNIIKEYNLNYAFDNNSDHLDFGSKLVEVICNNSGLQYNSTVFKWDDDLDHLPIVDENIPLIDAPIDPGYVFIGNHYCNGDFDGDGLKEILKFSFSEDNYGSIHKRMVYNDPIITNGVITYNSDINGTGISPNSLTIAADLDGDGKDELIIADANQAFVWKYVYQGGNTYDFRNVFSQITWGTPAFSYTGVEGFDLGNCMNCNAAERQNHYNAWLSNKRRLMHNYLQIGDFNGDGQLDFLYRNHDNTNGFYWKIAGYQNVNNVQTWVENWGSSIKFPNIENIIVADFNGDGKTEVLANGNMYEFNVITGNFDLFLSNTLTNFNYDKVRIGDFNGDGNADILYRSNQSDSLIWRAKIFNGKDLFNEILTFSATANVVYYLPGITPPTPVPLLIDNTYNHIYDYNTYLENVDCADINGDGKTDIIYTKRIYSNPHPTIYGVIEVSPISTLSDIYYSEGNQFFQKTYNYDLGYALDNDKVSDGMVSDFNGDTKSELYNGNKMISIYPYKKDKLLTKIDNGLGSHVIITYETTAKEGVYSRPGGTTGGWSIDIPYYTTPAIVQYPYMSNSTPFYVVSSAFNTNGVTNGNIHGENMVEHNYTYEDAIVHLQGKGFLTFRNVDDKNLNDETINHHTFSYAYSFPFLSSNILQKNYDPWKIVTQTNYTRSAPVLINYNGSKRYKFYISSITNLNGLTNTSKTTTFASPDSYGNITSTTAQIGSSQWQSTVVNQFLNIDNVSTGGKLIVGLPTSSTTTRTRSGETPVTNIVNNTFDQNNGHLLTQTTEPNNALLTTTTSFEYYPIGSLKKTTVLAVNDNKSRFSTVEYDSKYRFVTKKTNQLGYTNLYTYENKYGNVLTETDANGHITNNQYDAFGKPIKTIDYLGNEVNTAAQWVTSANTNAPSGSMFYITQTKTGVAPNISYFDRIGRTLGSESKNFGNFTVLNLNIYNNKGQLISETLPYYVGATPQTVDYTFDEYNRLLTKIGPTENTEIAYTPNSSETITTNHLLGIENTTNYDAAGNVTSTFDGTNTMSYAYNSAGLVKEITDDNSNVTSMTYDNLGNKLTLTDPDLGLTSYAYTGFGELKTQTDARNKVNTLLYDEIGRLRTKTITEATDTIVTYTYGTTLPSIGLLVSKEIGANGAPSYYKETYTYNANSQNIGKTVNLNIGTHAHTYNSSMAYDNLGRLQQYNYPTSLGIIYNYNAYTSEINQITKASDGSNIWQCNAENYLGQITNITKGNVATAFTFDATNHLLTNINTGSSLVQNWTYTYNNNLQLTSRNSNVGGNNLTESFSYDNLNRLTGYGTKVVGYNANGNITSKSDAGNYTYGTLPHAVTNIESGNPAQIATQQQDISYNYLNKVSTVNENGNHIDINYGTDQQRIIAKTLFNGTLTGTKHYIDNIEIEENASGTTTRTLSYISSPTGVAAIYDGTNMNYVHTDNLGSYDVITNAAGTVLQRNSFDAWGRRRNATNWTYIGVPTSFLFNRGYTGHEHLDKFTLINMNGRIYDPIVGRFLSADPFVQNPGNSQSYNRYSYCMNNPLAATDPSGYTAIGGGHLDSDLQRAGEEANKRFQMEDYEAMQAYRPSGLGGGGCGTGPYGGDGGSGFGGMNAYFTLGGSLVGTGSVGGGFGGSDASYTSAGSDFITFNRLGGIGGIGDAIRGGRVTGPSGGLYDFSKSYVGSLNATSTGHVVSFSPGTGDNDHMTNYFIDGQSFFSFDGGDNGGSDGWGLSFYSGVPIISSPWVEGGGFTPGPFVVTPPGVHPTPGSADRDFIQHEIGHTLTFLFMGTSYPLYYSTIAIPSVINYFKPEKFGGNHDYFYTEQIANTFSELIYGPFNGPYKEDYPSYYKKK